MEKVSALPMCMVLVAMVTVTLIANAPVSEAVTCNPSELTPCLPAFSSGKPSSACCAKLKEQKPCLCGYLKNPSLKQYVGSPAAKKILSACSVPYPRC